MRNNGQVLVSCHCWLVCNIWELQLSGTKINKIESSPTARKRVLLSLHFHVSYSLFQSLILFLILVATQTEVTTEDTAVVMQTDAASVTKSVNTVTEETATPPIVIASNKSTSCQNQVCEIALQLQLTYLCQSSHYDGLANASS